MNLGNLQNGKVAFYFPGNKTEQSLQKRTVEPSFFPYKKHSKPRKIIVKSEIFCNHIVIVPNTFIFTVISDVLNVCKWQFEN